MNWNIILFTICLPLRHLEITSSFGYRIHPITKIYSFHSGVDLRAMETGYDGRLGLFVRLDHSSFQSSYGHLSQVFLGQGDTVLAGQPIGITGRTGQVTGEHLHFSIRCGNQYVDPLEFLYKQLILQHHE